MGTMTRQLRVTPSDCAEARVDELVSSRIRDNQNEYIAIMSVLAVCIGITLAAIATFQPVAIDSMAVLYWN